MNKRTLADGKELYSGQINNRRVLLRDWKGKTPLNSDEPKYAEYDIWDKSGNKSLAHKSGFRDAQDALDEVEQYANSLPNFRGWIIALLIIVILIISILSTVYTGQ